MTPVEVLAAHQTGIWHGWVYCRCGCVFQTREAHAAHVLDALTKAGHVVVTLPEAGVDGLGAPEWRFDDGSVSGGSVAIRKSDGRIGVYCGTPLDTPEQARALALALLAAAAETGGKA